MPVSVKPRPSWIGLKPSAVIMIRNEKPSVPSGRRVVTRPMAVSVRLPLIVSWTMPPYWPLSGSKNR